MSCFSLKLLEFLLPENRVALTSGFSPVTAALQSYKETKLSMSVEIFTETICLEQAGWPARACFYNFGFFKKKIGVLMKPNLVMLECGSQLRRHSATLISSQIFRSKIQNQDHKSDFL